MDAWQNAIHKLEFAKVRQRILRYAASDLGKSYISKLAPSTSAETIRINLRIVHELKSLLETDTSPPLEGIFDVRATVRRAAIEGTILTPKEIHQVLSTMRAAREVRQFFSKRREHYPATWNIAATLFVDKVLEYNLANAVDDSGNVRDSASRELQSIRRSLTEKYELLGKKLESILKEATAQGIAQDEIITTREGRMVIPVKAEHKHRLRGFIHSASASGATVFVEPSETLDLNNEIRTLHFQEQREVERILRELTKQIGDLHKQIDINLKALEELDGKIAIANYAIESVASVSDITSIGPIKLVGTRHPLLLQTRGRDGTVPLDLELGSSYRTLIISGPNAGGKSVAMKCVGLLTLMTQSGIPIPAAEGTVIRVFDKMFVEIGDEQSIENDLSTFSSHLSHLKAIAEEADESTLVLIDEIGSGTDPTEGSAIASAILEVLTQRGAYTIATTHHGSLKVFAHATPGVENGAMEFDQHTLSPTYRFRVGIPGSSYALEMAQRLGFNEDILRRAREFLGTQATAMQMLIEELEMSANRYRKDLEDLQQEKKKLNDLVGQYEQRLRKQAEELRELKRNAVEEARSIVQSANALIERSIREIRETAASRDTVRQVRENVNRLRERILDRSVQLQPTKAPPTNEEIRVGSIVTIGHGADAGEVISISPDRSHAVVVFGNVKMKVAMHDLTLAFQRAKQITPSAPPSAHQASATRDLDLRGMTGDEAIPLVDKFIDSAILAGLHRVDIIHGKGTGALRQKIADFLAKHPRVKSFRLGEWNEGGTGATVVELTDD